MNIEKYQKWLSNQLIEYKDFVYHNGHEQIEFIDYIKLKEIYKGVKK